MTTRYVIVPVTAITAEMIAASEITSILTLRKSLDGTLGILSYQGDKPSIFSPYTDYSEADAQALMATSAWEAARPVPV